MPVVNNYETAAPWPLLENICLGRLEIYETTVLYFHCQIFENGVLWGKIVIGDVTKFRKLFENFRQIALFFFKMASIAIETLIPLIH